MNFADAKNIKSIFFGHSLGGIVAYELSRLFENLNLKFPSQLIISSVKHPNLLTSLNLDENYQKKNLLSDNNLFEHIEAIGGLPPGVHPDFLRISLKSIREDYKIFESYSFENKSIISIPITTMSGKIDQFAPAQNMYEWANYTSGNYNHYEFGDSFTGDHFYFNDRSLKDEVIQTINLICCDISGIKFHYYLVMNN